MRRESFYKRMAEPLNDDETIESGAGNQAGKILNLICIMILFLPPKN